MSSITAGTTSTTTLIHSGDTTGSLVFKTNDTGSGGTTAVTIDTSQNVGIGTTSPTSGKLVISGTSVTTSQGIRLVGDTADARFICESATLGAGILGTFSNHSQLFYTNSAERMRIDTSGHVLINATSTGSFSSAANLCVLGASGEFSAVFRAPTTSTYNVISLDNPNGQVGRIQTSGSATSFLTSSDYRLKENIAPMTGALAKVALLKPVIYKWKVDGTDGQGFIAHELQEVVPDCVGGDKDAVDANGNPVYQGIDTSFLVATLTAALQETKALIDQQAETINAQSEAIASLTARVVALEGQ
jgi:hypothetical protein